MPVPSSRSTSPPPPGSVSPANMLGLDYASLAAELPYRGDIIDIHTHVSMPRGCEVYLQAARDFGVVRTFTMTGLDHAREVNRLHPDAFDFICVPDYRKYMENQDPHVFIDHWLDDIRGFREELGCRILKLWAAPRGRDFFERADGSDKFANDPLIGNPMLLDSPIRQRGIELALDLGYRCIMMHVGDPDTWFATKYADAARYGTKPDQYVPMRQLMQQCPDVPFIGAHTGGYPENLDFVQALLDEHDNYHVDISATKWQVRELSKHPQRFAEFCEANPGRVLFGTDIVANDENVVPSTPDPDDPEPRPGIGAGHGYDLYASRYWAMRTLVETDYHGPSPIVDPDLHMVDPTLPEDSTATLRGAALPADRLQDIYHDAAAALLNRIGV